MATYMVRAGHEVGQNGKTFAAGSLIEIEPHQVSGDLAFKVDLCDANGKLVVLPAAPVLVELERALPHERMSILVVEQTRLTAAIADAQVSKRDDAALAQLVADAATIDSLIAAEVPAVVKEKVERPTRTQRVTRLEE